MAARTVYPSIFGTVLASLSAWQRESWFWIQEPSIRPKIWMSRWISCLSAQPGEAPDINHSLSNFEALVRTPLDQC